MSINKFKIRKWLIYLLASIMLLIGFIVIYESSCFYGFQYYVYKAGLVGDGVIGNVKVKMKGNWYPLWITNIHIKSDTSKYPSISYARHDNCEDNEFISFYKLPDNYYEVHDLKNASFETREFPWGSAKIKKYDTSDLKSSKDMYVVITDLFIAIEVYNLEYLNEIENLKQIKEVSVD